MASGRDRIGDENYVTALQRLMQECLPQILVELIDKRPLDPIEYMAHSLYKYGRRDETETTHSSAQATNQRTAPVHSRDRPSNQAPLANSVNSSRVNCEQARVSRVKGSNSSTNSVPVQFPSTNSTSEHSSNLDGTQTRLTTGLETKSSSNSKEKQPLPEHNTHSVGIIGTGSYVNNRQQKHSTANHRSTVDVHKHVTIVEADNEEFDAIEEDYMDKLSVHDPSRMVHQSCISVLHGNEDMFDDTDIS